MPQSPDIGQNPDGGISDFHISGQCLINENCNNCRTSDDIDMKLGPVPKLGKRNKTTSKKFDVNVMSRNVTSLSFFGFLANSEQSEGLIPETESEKVIFSVIVTFFLQKRKTELKNF